MITKAIQNKLVRRLLVGVVASIVTVGATSAEPASAWQYTGNFGSIGNADLPTIYVGDIYGLGGGKYFTVFGSAGATVYRSPASTGTQLVRVQYFVERWNGVAWVVQASSGILSGQILNGQSGVRFAAPYLMPMVTTGYFRASYGIVWLNSAGTVLGGAAVLPSLASDHVCTTVNPNRSCQSFGQYVLVG